MPNLYCTPADLIARRPMLSGAAAALLLDLIEACSRTVDEFCGRHFYAQTATRLLKAATPMILDCGDLLSVTSLETDNAGDDTYATAWTAEDYRLSPSNDWPKRLLLAKSGKALRLPCGVDGVRLAGIFGHGDGERADPFALQVSTATAAGATGSITTSASGALTAGQTFRLGSEQLLATAVSGATVVAVRGVNGTTAAIHAANTPLYTALYPASVRLATVHLALDEYSRAQRDMGLSSEMIGQGKYQWTAIDPARHRALMSQMLGAYKILSA